jgi:hypothetical protein
MGKRGPSAKGEFGDKSAVLSTRISAELRAALEASVERTGLTLSREIEHRLRRTFSDEEKIEAAFGSERNYRLMQMAALAIRHAAWNVENPDADWIDDPVAFEIALRAVNNILEALRPPSGAPRLDPLAERSAVEEPARIWRDVQAADASLPLNNTGRKHLANRTKAALGKIADRARVPPASTDKYPAEVLRIEKALKNKRKAK